MKKNVSPVIAVVIIVIVLIVVVALFMMAGKGKTQQQTVTSTPDSMQKGEMKSKMMQQMESKLGSGEQTMGGGQ
jgi:flagellar basal body-associated protein FliL